MHSSGELLHAGVLEGYAACEAEVIDIVEEACCGTASTVVVNEHKTAAVDRKDIYIVKKEVYSIEVCKTNGNNI